jgi:uncharacterized membrane protein YdbT with pleckstrin-like domain
MSYTRSSSAVNEQVIHRTNESGWFVFSGFVFYTLLILFLAVGFEGWAFLLYGFWIKNLVQRWFTEYCVTNRRVVSRRGVIRRVVRELDLRAVEGVDLHQTVIGRILGYGTVWVRGRGGVSVEFSRIGGAVKFKRLLQESLDSRG